MTENRKIASLTPICYSGPTRELNGNCFNKVN
jgi:hypothetical protein